MEPTAHSAQREPHQGTSRSFTERIGRSLAGQTTVSALVRVSAAGTSLLANIALAKLLGAHDYGTYAFLVNVVTVAATAGKWGWDKASVRFVSQYLALGEHDTLAHFLHSRRRWTLALSLVAAIAGGLWIAYSPLHVDIASLTASVLLVPATVAGLLLQSTLRGAALSTVSEIPEGIVKPVVTVIATVAAISIWPSDDVLGAATCALLLGSLLSNALSMLLSRHLPRAAVEPRLASSQTSWHRAVADYGMLGFAQVALTRLPVVIAGMLISAEELARLAIAARLADVVILAVSSIGLVSAPRLSGLYHTGAIKQCRQILRDATLYSSVVGITLCVAMLLAGKAVLSLFGAEFVDAYPLLACLCVAQVVAAVCGPVGYVPTMSGHQRQALHITAAGAIAGSLLTLPLARSAGAIGVGLSLAVSAIATNLILARLARQVLAGTKP